ncbi:MAG: PilZ domain-containing protein [Planctomycetota bacterium]
MLDDEPIPLEECTLTWADIVPDQRVLDAPIAESGAYKRSHARHDCTSSSICLTIEHSSGKVEHVECPVMNMSTGGFAILFDGALRKGTRGTVSYRSAMGKPVQVACTVLHCAPVEEGRFKLGLKLDRPLRIEEARPARTGHGREVSPGLRPRKLKAMPAAQE